MASQELGQIYLQSEVNLTLRLVQRYRALLDEVLTNDLLADVCIHLQQQRALGHDAFLAMVETKTHRFAGVRPAHRPRKPARTTE